MGILINNDGTTPSAFQIRFGGAKGVVVVDPRLESHDLHLRPSQIKFQSDYRELEILSISQNNLCFLNQQIIVLLEARGVPHENILEMLHDALDGAEKVANDVHAARRELNQMGIFSSDAGSFNVPREDDKDPHVLGDVDVGSFILEEPFFRSLLQFKYMLRMGRLKSKTSILVEKGALLLGVPDPYDFLAEGEVFLRVSQGRGRRDESLKIVEGRVVVCKNPCLHPGDILDLNAVPCARLNHIVDCVVFSTRGSRPIPDQTAGSDLDGDLFFVTWDPRLIPPVKDEAMTFDENGTSAGGILLLFILFSLFLLLTDHTIFFSLASSGGATIVTAMPPLPSTLLTFLPPILPT